MLNARALIGSHDLLFMTLDTLRFDVADRECREGRTPNLAALLPGGRWQKRHTPASFTLPAHQAFLAGFLPTPITPGPHPRLFAPRFEGSATTVDETFVFDAADLATGLGQVGYRTICIGGVGFFNQRTPLGRLLPDLFDESHWSEELGVTNPDSTRCQVERACARLEAMPPATRCFLLVNVSALHQPNRCYLDGGAEDSIESHAAALRYVDSQLPALFAALRQRGPALCIICSDHGTAYGEEGYSGHRLGHPVVWEVPYAELLLEGAG